MRTRLLVRCVLSIFVAFLVLSIGRPAAASDNDSLASYIDLSSQRSYMFAHFRRQTNPTQWVTSLSTQTFRYYRDSRGYMTFERQQTGGFTEAGGKYFERYIWDSQHTWLYPDYFSLYGDIYPSRSSAANCRTSPVFLDGCDYVVPAGQEWLPNVTASPAQGTNTSQSFLIWDSSTIGANQGHHWIQGGIVRGITHEIQYGQVWKRNAWDTSAYRVYANGVNNAEAIGYPDVPGLNTLQDALLAPKYVYIVRQYSDCVTSNINAPWNSCRVFEDHVYAKDANNNQLGEILAVFGYTPAVMGGNYYQVYEIMIALY